MEWVAILKPSKAGQLRRNHANEKRHRCRHCGIVNVFHPERASVRDLMELKIATERIA